MASVDATLARVADTTDPAEVGTIVDRHGGLIIEGLRTPDRYRRGLAFDRGFLVGEQAYPFPVELG